MLLVERGFLYGMCTYVLLSVDVGCVLLSVVCCVTLVVRCLSFVDCHVSLVFLLCVVCCVLVVLLVVVRWSLFVAGCVYVF